MKIATHAGRTILAMLGISLLPWTARPVAAAGSWDLSFSGLVGGSFPMDINGYHYVDPAADTDLIVDDISNQKSVELGGRFSVWKPRASGLEWGAQAEILTFKVDQVDGATYSYHGIVDGEPTEGTDTQVEDDARLMHFATAFLVRWPMGARDQFKGGRWAPYLGVGVGIERVDERTEPTFVTSDPMFLVLGGARVMVSSKIGLFGEYRHTRSGEHEISDTKPPSPGVATLKLRDNHLLGGVSIHF